MRGSDSPVSGMHAASVMIMTERGYPLMYVVALAPTSRNGSRGSD